MIKCVLTKVAAAAAVAVGSVGAAAYYETNGEILNYVGMSGTSACPLAALAASVCGGESACPLTVKSSGCCSLSESLVESTYDPVAATVGGLAFAVAPNCAVESPATALEPAAASASEPSPQ
jgi:hypothetical protein